MLCGCKSFLQPLQCLLSGSMNIQAMVRGMKPAYDFSNVDFHIFNLKVALLTEDPVVG